jgi:hypothetical protein
VDDSKLFEVRIDDRNPPFAVGDVLQLREYGEIAIGGVGYTGKEVHRRVTYVLRHDDLPAGVPEGWVVMGLTRKGQM